jgi:hypothetical protein
MAKSRLVYDIVAELLDVTACERTIRVSSGATLGRFNHVLCTAFGWPSDGPYVFTASHLRFEGRWTPAAPQGDVREMRLRQLLPDVGARLDWQYGPGGRRQVALRLARVHLPDELLVTPTCLAARGLPPSLEAARGRSSSLGGTVDGATPVGNGLVVAINAALARLR